MGEFTLQTPPQIAQQLEDTSNFDPVLFIETLTVISHNGEVTPYEENRIKQTLVELSNAQLTTEQCDELTQQITQTLAQQFSSQTVITSETIEDQLELHLLRMRLYQIAETLQQHRQEKREKRRQTDLLQVSLPNGNQLPLNKNKIKQIVSEACKDLAATDEELLFTEAEDNFYDGIAYDEIYNTLINTCQQLAQQQTLYQQSAVRLFLNKLHNEALAFLGLGNQISMAEMNKLYPVYFKTYVEKAIQLNQLPEQCKAYNLEKLALIINPNQDEQFDSETLQRLYRYYLLKHNQTCYELPQAFLMRTALGIAKNEDEAIAIYQNYAVF